MCTWVWVPRLCLHWHFFSRIKRPQNNRKKTFGKHWVFCPCEFMGFGAPAFVRLSPNWWILQCFNWNWFGLQEQRLTLANLSRLALDSTQTQLCYFHYVNKCFSFSILFHKMKMNVSGVDMCWMTNTQAHLELNSPSSGRLRRFSISPSTAASQTSGPLVRIFFILYFILKIVWRASDFQS